MAKQVETARAPMPAFQKAMLWFFTLSLVISVALRMLVSEPQPGQTNPMPEGARSFAAEAVQKEGEDPGTLQELLPIVTEASLFGLIGFALGYTSRKALKLVLIAIAIAFVVVQIQVARGVMEVDWGGVMRAIDAWLLNLKAEVPIMEFLQQRLPTAVVFGVGYLVGFRRG